MRDAGTDDRRPCSTDEGNTEVPSTTTPALYDSSASYMSKAFESPDALIDHARRALKGLDFDSVVGRGLSGALAVPIIGRALGKHWAIVRKEDGSHSSRKVEGTIGSRWIFVDDFVASGATRSAVVRAISRLEIPTLLVGTYQYESSDRMFIPHDPPVPSAHALDALFGPDVLCATNR
jgi:adenine/guanine phosphoribosyltransferase-like PRPP-binding protein